MSQTTEIWGGADWWGVPVPQYTLVKGIVWLTTASSSTANNMLSFISLAAIFFIALFCLAYVRIYLATSYLGGCPRVGRSGVLGYVIEALRYTLDAESVILKGRARFNHKPFVIPTLVDYSAPFRGVDIYLTMPCRVDHCFSWDRSTWTVYAQVLMKLCVRVNPCI